MDDRLRRLERAAATGGPGEREALRNEHRRRDGAWVEKRRTRQRAGAPFSTLAAILSETEVEEEFVVRGSGVVAVVLAVRVGRWPTVLVERRDPVEAGEAVLTFVYRIRELRSRECCVEVLPACGAIPATLVVPWNLDTRVTSICVVDVPRSA